tara:strand:+ start:154 stop:411 length:258 start_codon:yes stop_codon:yes gene_type:complete
MNFFIYLKYVWCDFGVSNISFLWVVEASALTLNRSRVGFQWALPGVVVGVVMPFSVSVSYALKFLVSDVVVSIGVWSFSVDALLS